jgi:subtilisin family serine protease
MTRRPLPAIDADSRRIEPCEQRLALSASLAGDLLLEALNIGATTEIDPQAALPIEPQSSQIDPIDSTINGQSPDLIQQAAEIRESHGLDGRGQTVAVIDSGVAWDHVAFGKGFGPGYRVVGGWDFAENDANPYDDGPAGYHGTHVSGLLAGQTDGYVGVAPGADIVALRVFDDKGAGQLQWIESALQWVHQNQDSFASPITTINLSVGAALSDTNRGDAMEMLEDELQLLRENDILVFAASGNLFGSTSATTDGVLYPASSPSVVAVASVEPSGDLSTFAQREADVLATRGESIAGSVPDHVFGWDGKVDDFAELDGTSMATPQVAAASMLVRQAMIHEGLEPTADAVLSRLRGSAVESVDPVTGATYHTIDLKAAINFEGETGVPSVVAPTTIDRFDGSNEGERVELDLRDGIQLRVGDLTYTLDSDAVDSPLVIDVGGGDDSLSILGSQHAERLIVQPPTMQDDNDATSSISTNTFRIELRGFENVSFQGGGGPDRATLFDSTGADTLTSHPAQATLEGSGFQFDVHGVPRVYVHGTAGGNDTAFLHDSEGDDVLAVRPQFTSLRSDAAFQLAYGFERVYAYAAAGGVDNAQLYDSEGDDTMSVSSERSMIAGPGYHISARGFDSAEGHAIAGGNDVARLYADETSSRWHATNDMTQWTGENGAVRIARGFERTLAFEQYEPIELTPQSTRYPLSPWFIDDAKQRAEREAAAARAVFDQFGDA